MRAFKIIICKQIKASGEELACQCKRHGFDPLGREDPLEEGMATHSSILSCEIPWTEEPGGLQSMGSQRVGHDLATKQQQHGFSEDSEP